MKKTILPIIAIFSASQLYASDWEGCYFGLNGSYANGDNRTVNTLYQGDSTRHYAGSADSSGSTYGLQLGCDMDLTTNWVFGTKITAQNADIDGKHVFEGGTGSENYFWYKSKDLYTITGRIGYTFNDSSLLYFQGGWAQSKQVYNDVDPTWTPPIDFYKSKNLTGWTVGLGLEHKFNENFSLFGEFNRLDFGTEGNILFEDRGNIGIDDYTVEVEQSMNNFVVGVNYHF
ncbi:MAG TPA: porin family protein [Gammaproteobacteria bacterium]|nr:porin family protein [Xanthomonadales bacterium]MCB1594941.1 porin family protein [Xanthomonadales bacterium]HOP21667.1 porin family protein [Gammaproteobacteria bacterium]HPI95789.1 porin family protein [Gammaproteobacteria bacterium]